MGKITVAGKAEREVQYDAIELEISFYVQGNTTGETLSKVMEQSERFLSFAASLGIDTKQIHIGDNSINQRYNDEKLFVRAKREMTIRLGFDMKFVNWLMDEISEQGFDVDLDVDYKLKDSQLLHTELLKEAIEDSRKKASIIAEAVGQSIVGIDSVAQEGYSCNRLEMHEREILCSSVPTFRNKLSDDLAAPMTAESESVEVAWIIE